MYQEGTELQMQMSGYISYKAYFAMVQCTFNDYHSINVGAVQRFIYLLFLIKAKINNIVAFSMVYTVCISCITFPCDLPDMYTLSLRPAAIVLCMVYISGKSFSHTIAYVTRSARNPQIFTSLKFKEFSR